MLKQLEVENKVNLQDSVTKYIHWFKTNKEITIKDLMLHKVDYINMKLQLISKFRTGC